VVTLFLAEGRTESALVLAAYVLQEITTWNEIKRRLETAVELIRSELPADTFAAALERGRQMSLEEAKKQIT